MKVGIKIDRSVEEVEVLITAQEQSRTVDSLYEHIAGFDKKSLETCKPGNRLLGFADRWNVTIGVGRTMV